MPMIRKQALRLPNLFLEDVSLLRLTQKAPKHSSGDPPTTMVTARKSLPTLVLKKPAVINGREEEEAKRSKLSEAAGVF